MAFTKDCSTGVFTVYFNGSKVGVFNNMTRPIHGLQMSKFKIGCHSWAWTPFFNGILDDMRIYNRVLTQGECVYLAGFSGTFTQPLLGQAGQTDRALINDNFINFKDFAKLAGFWLEKKFWP